MLLNIKLIYVNRRWNLYIKPSTGNNWKMVETITSASETSGQYSLRRYDVPGLSFPLFSFGYWYNERSRRPGHGGEWSSRSSIVNEVFNKEIMEVAYDGVVFSMDRKDVEGLVKIVGAEVRTYVSGGETYWGIFLSTEDKTTIEFTTSITAEEKKV